MKGKRPHMHHAQDTRVIHCFSVCVSVASYPGCFKERKEKGLVNTVCACAISLKKQEIRISCFITVNSSYVSSKSIISTFDLETCEPFNKQRVPGPFLSSPQKGMGTRLV